MGWWVPIGRHWIFAEVPGGRSRIRTYDPLIKSQLLYQLSYAPAERSAPGRRGYSKRTPACKPRTCGALRRPRASASLDIAVVWNRRRGNPHPNARLAWVRVARCSPGWRLLRLRLAMTGWTGQPYPAPHRLTPRRAARMSRRARRPDGRCPPGPPGGQRKVRAPREYGAGQLPAGATPGKVPQKTNRPRAQCSYSGVPRARVKRCGKSAPRPWQQGRQGKPHREQDRIGAAGGMGRRPTLSHGRGGIPASSPGLVARGVPQGTSQRNGRLVPEGKPAGTDRTRLTGRLAHFFHKA